jgi:hypothetical protein
MDAESLSSSEDLKPAATDEIGASTTDELDYGAFGFSGIPPSPPKTSFPRWNEDRFEDGYDSDGEILLSEDELVEIHDDEEALPSTERGPDNQTTIPGAVGAEHRLTGGDLSTAAHISSTAIAQNLTIKGEVLTDALISKMKVDDIRVELGRRGLLKRGNKAEIIPRLQRAISDGILPSLASLDGNHNNEEVRSLRDFPAGAKWIEMPFKSLPIEEASTLIDGVQFRGPTDVAGMVHHQRLHDVDMTIDRLTFPGKALLPKKISTIDSFMINMEGSRMSCSLQMKRWLILILLQVMIYQLTLLQVIGSMHSFHF